MTAKKKYPTDKINAGTTRNLRDDAEKELLHSPKGSPDQKEETLEALNHELQVHKVELEMQTEELRRTQIALEESRDKYIDLYEFAPVGYLTLNNKGLVNEANLSAATLLHAERNTLINHGFGVFITPEHLQTWDQYFKLLLIQREKQTCTLMLNRGDGSTFPARLEGVATTSSRGTITVRIAISDIADIWQIQALRESERTMKDIISFLPDATLVINTEGIVIAWNHSMEEMTGIPAEQIIGKANYEYALPFYHERRPITVDLILHDDMDVVQKYPVMTKEGNSLFSEIFIPHLNKGRGAHLWFKASPLYDEAGNLTGAIESIRDITERKQAEETLRESEQQYRSILENANEGILIVDIDSGLFNHANPSICRMLGYPKEEFLKMGVADIHPKEDMDHVISEFKSLLTGKTTIAKNIPCLRNDGEIRIMDITSSTVMIHGKTYLTGLFTDSTERMRAEEAVQTAVKLNQVIDIMSVSECMSFTLDEAERLTTSKIGFFHLINPDEQTIHLVAWSTETKKSCYIPKEPERYYPVSKAGVWVDCLHERKPTIQNDYASMPHKKGLPEGHVPVIRELVVPIFDEEKIVAIIGVGNKATDYGDKDINVLTLLAKNTWTLIQRKWIEKALMQSEIKFHTMADFTIDWEYWLAPDSSLVYISPSCENIAGYSPDEFTTDPVLLNQIVYPEDTSLFADHIHRIHENAELETLDFRIVKKNGDIRWIAHSCMPIHGRDGAYLGRRVSNRDITERKQMEMSLHEALQKLRLLTGITRHDVVNDLNIITLSLEMVRDTNDPDIIQKYISYALEAGKTLENTIGFTREYENFGSISSRWSHLLPIINSARSDVSTGRIMVHIEISPDIEVYADPIIRKVFTTLFENSIRHGGSLSTIRVSTEEQKDALIVTYEDDGVGIPSEEKKYIFDHGYGKHTGIGLFLAREILSITGLSIRETGVPGKGVRFEIQVPHNIWRVIPTS